MNGGSTVLNRFADALMQPGGPIPDGITAKSGPDIGTRFGVYRNNVFSSLIEALKDSYPVIAQLVGETFFTAMARKYVMAHPPTSPVLLEYGKEFPDFLDNFPPVAGLSYLSDVARLEAAWLSAYHSADAAYATADDFSNIPPDTMVELRFEIHPACRVLSSSWPIHAIWDAHQADEAPDTIDISPSNGEVCITRPVYEVLVAQAGAGTSRFANALAEGLTLGHAAEQATSEYPEFQLSATLACLIGQGAFCRVHSPTNP